MDDVVESHACDVCGKVFRKESTLEAHLLMHTNGKEYRCVECDECFTFQWELTKHTRSHNERNLFKCDIVGCDKTYQSLGNLRTHVKCSHIGERRHTCPVCGKKFLLGTHLRTHQRTHSEERTHVCGVCAKSFREVGSLRRHMTVHTGERNFECTECGKTFPIANNLTKHLRTHTGERPYSCQVCGKCFSSGSNLKTHHKSHTGEKLYLCELCQKRFTLSSHLKAHIQTHDRLQHFTCSECGKSFGTLASLRRHLSLHVNSVADNIMCYVSRVATTDTTAKDNINFTVSDKITSNSRGVVLIDNDSNASLNCETDNNLNHATNSSVPLSYNHSVVQESTELCSIPQSNWNLQNASDAGNLLQYSLSSQFSLLKRFSCSSCERTFMSEQVLRLHMLSHSADQQHACPNCSTTFMEKASLIRHMKIHPR